MSKSKVLTTLIAVGAVVLTSIVTPASAARRHVGWRNAAVAAGYRRRFVCGCCGIWRLFRLRVRLRRLWLWWQVPRPVRWRSVLLTAKSELNLALRPAPGGSADERDGKRPTTSPSSAPPWSHKPREVTRSRASKKNHQAFVEQENGGNRSLMKDVERKSNPGDRKARQAG
jgi:hypothetical protein